MTLDLWLEEKVFFEHGLTVAGVDEAGRGPLAGPVVAAAVCSKHSIRIDGVFDSKTLRPKKRSALRDAIMAHPDLMVGVGVASVEEIDSMNILNASLYAFYKALKSLSVAPDMVLVDGNKTSPYWKGRQQALIKGDQRSFLISAASIIAKETRDEMMHVADTQYPQYGFIKHKGYGTKMHLEALKDHGPCDMHRKTFKPVRDVMTTQERQGAAQ